MVRSLSYLVSAFAIIVMLTLFGHALLYGNYVGQPSDQPISNNWIVPTAMALFAAIAGVAISRYGREYQR